MAFDIDGARKAGYSDDQILEFLSSKANFDVAGARAAGYKTADMLPAVLDRVNKREKAALTKPEVSDPDYVPPINPTLEPEAAAMRANPPPDRGPRPKDAGVMFDAPAIGDQRPLSEQRAPEGYPAPLSAEGARTLESAARAGAQAPEPGKNQRLSTVGRGLQVAQQRTQAEDQAQADQVWSGATPRPGDRQYTADLLRPTRDEASVSAPTVSPVDAITEYVRSLGGDGAANAVRGTSDTVLSAVKALPQTSKLLNDMGRLLTFDLVSSAAGDVPLPFTKAYSEWAERGSKALGQLQSYELRKQSGQLGMLMADPNINAGGVRNFVLQNPGLLLDQALPSAGSMLVSAGAAGAAGRMAVARAMERGMARAAADELGRTAATRVASISNALMNAGDTFDQTKGDLANRYAAASIAFLGTLAVNKATGGGVEGQLGRRAAGARMTGVSPAIGENPVAARLYGAGKGVIVEPTQEYGEQISQDVGQALAEGRPLDLNDLNKSATLAATAALPLGGVGGAFDVPSNVRQGLSDPFDAAAMLRAKGFLYRERAAQAQQAEQQQRAVEDQAIAGAQTPDAAVDAALAATSRPNVAAAELERQAVDLRQQMAEAGLSATPGQPVQPAADAVAAEIPGGDAAPINPGAPTAVDAAASEAATSPANDRPEPTDGQKDAGNYKKGKITISGLPVSIENEAGTSRRPEWPPLQDHYGYFRRTEGADGDHIDVFIKPGTPDDFSGAVFVVDQRDPKTGKFDEHKVVVGAADMEEAKAIYRRNYSADWDGLGAITAMPWQQFKLWAMAGNTKRALAYNEQAPAAPTQPAEMAGQPTIEQQAAQDERARKGDASLQNRNRSSAESVRQMQSIAADPDPARLSFSRTLADGAPVVFFNGDKTAASMVRGNYDVAVDADGKRIAVQYAVVSANDVTASHRADGTVVAEYGDATEGRIRAVNNGRIAGLQRAYEIGTAARYTKGIAADEALTGIGAQQIAGIRNPVLVRVMGQADVTADIGARSNTRQQIGLTVTEQAQTDATRVKPDAFEFLSDGRPSDATLNQFVESMPATERAELRGDDGRPNVKAEQRMMAALFWASYADEGLLKLAAEARDPESKVVIGALARVAGDMAKLQGAGQWDIRPIVVDAARFAVNVARQGMPLNQAAAQTDLDMRPESQAVVQFFADNIRSAKAIADGLRQAAALAYAEQSAGAADMFDDRPQRTAKGILHEGLELEGENPDAGRPQGVGEQGRPGGPDGGTEQQAAGRDEPEPGAQAVEPGERAEENPLLANPTPEELRRREAERERAQQEKTRTDNAPPPGDFILTGSDRAVDQAEARGQSNLFDQPATAENAGAKTRTEEERANIERHRASYEAQAHAALSNSPVLQALAEKPDGEIEAAAMEQLGAWIESQRKAANDLEGEALTEFRKDAKTVDALIAQAVIAARKNAKAKADKDKANREKLRNTGVDLKRAWDEYRAKMRAENDAQGITALNKIRSLAARADLFDVLGEGATPGLIALRDEVRGSVRPFMDWMEQKTGSFYGARYRRATYAEQLEDFIKGSASPRGDYGDRFLESYANGLSPEEWSSLTIDQRLQIVAAAADDYITRVQTIASVFEGKTKLADTLLALQDMLFANPKAPLKSERFVSDDELSTTANELRDAGLLSGDRFIREAGYGNARMAERISKENDAGQLQQRAKPMISPRLDNPTRDLPSDHRAGKHVTPQQFKDAFGFADIGFGTWVQSGEDQDHLNRAYDAFMDLAAHLGVDPKMIGMGGRLHFTLGALGQGAKAAATFHPAHPNPDGGFVQVINLTKTRGDGTVSHEWFHALDHFLSKDENGERAMREILLALSKQFDLDRVREAIIGGLEHKRWMQGSKRVSAQENAKNLAEYYRRRGQSATLYKRNADAMDPNYWGNPQEMRARAFESWVSDTLGGRNDYLVNGEWVGDGKIKPPTYKGTPYPTGEERELFGHWFSALARSLVVKTMDDGSKMIMLDPRAWEANKPTTVRDFDAAVTELIAEIPVLEAQLKQQREDEKRAQEAAAAQDAEDKRRQQEEARRAEQERLAAEQRDRDSQNVPPPPPPPSGPLSEADLESLFDEAADSVRAEAHENIEAPQPGEATRTGNAAPPKAPKITPTQDRPTPASAAKLMAEAAKLGVKGADEALTGLAKLFGSGPGRLNSFPGGFDEDTYAKAKPHFEAALRAFQEAGRTLKDLFKLLIEQFGEGVKPYAIRFAKDMQLGTNLAPTMTAPRRIANWVQQQLEAKQAFDWRDLFEQADLAYGGTQAKGVYTPKDAYDAMELGVNLYLQRSAGVVQEALSGNSVERAEQAIRSLDDLINLLPTQTKRTGEQDEFQQFSTVPALAFVASWVAKMTQADTMLEPSAGIGGLAAFARMAGATVVVNELSQRRAALLAEALPGARLFTENAEQINNVLPDDVVPTVVVMNPPFSATAGRAQGQRDTMNGARHIEQALARLAPGGRLVAIVGNGMDESAPRFKTWWKSIKDRYTVRANLNLSGEQYGKYGTTFDNNLLVIDNIGPQQGTTLTGRIENYDELPAKLEGIRNERKQPNGANQAPESNADRPAGAGPSSPGLPGQQPTAPTVPGGMGGGRGAGVGGSSGRGGNAGAAGRSGSRAGSGGAAGRSGERGGDQQPAQRSDEGGTDAAGGSGQPGVTEVQVEAGAVKRSTELTDSIYEQYVPLKARLAGSRPHPGKLVESAAMAAIEPADVTYTPNLPKDVVLSGKLSDAQLEALIYAGQAHSVMLPNGNRMGFFIGDGTGVGKGREISGIILDNIRQGRKRHVWVSEKSALAPDARRDFKGIDGDPDYIFELNKYAADEPIKEKQGVVFLSYDTLRSAAKSKDPKVKGKSRLDQLVDWLGADFDGVIAFDEAHNMGNLGGQSTGRGEKEASQKALAGEELQKRLPNARVVYVSATGATEVANLMYASRLGLWGPKTPFATATAFSSQISAAGLASMELVARDMKAMGAYIARSLSYEGVEYRRLEANLTALQTEIYDELAKAWQIVLQNIQQALAVTGAAKNGQAKGKALSAFWGAHQRFFNQVITSMATPAIIDDAQKAIAEGHAVVFQLVNTNEAEQERQLDSARANDIDLEELDFTPRQALINYIKNGFPVQQFETYKDEDGKTRSRPVVDSNGQPVLSKEAIAKRDALIEKLKDIRVPDNPLDLIIEALGQDNVAEVTGRGRRLVRELDRETGEVKLIEQKRGKNSNRADAEAFQGDRKRALIFSDAGGTGFSFHSDQGAKNQRRRIHYLVQPGWRADKAVQGFGRTHRSNEVNQPEYVLPTTQLKAQKRFISSIARRLDQLGALTKGQRNASGGNLFNNRDNLESVYAKAAMRALLTEWSPGSRANIRTSASGGEIDVPAIIAAMGLSDIYDPLSGGVIESKMPTIPRFLNRLLSLTTEQQDHVFSEFELRMDAAIEAAVKAGTYDDGMQTVRALKVRKLRDEQIHKDERTGAPTRYVELELTQAERLLSFEEARDAIASYSAGSDWQWYIDNRTGQPFALINKGDRTNADGTKQARGYRINIRASKHATGQYITNRDVIESGGGVVVVKRNAEGDQGPTEASVPRYQPIGEAHAAYLWDESYSTMPTTRTETLDMLTGALLPVWDRVQVGGSVSVVRTQTDDGERLIGRVIPRKERERVMRNFGLGAVAKDTPADVLMGRVLAGETALLSNGYQLKRVRVSDENRIEVVSTYLSGAEESNLRKAGAIVERIGFRNRVFVPTVADTFEALTRGMNRPVVDFVGGKQDDAGMEGQEFADLTPSRPLPGMYSALEREVAGINAKSMTPADWKLRLRALIGRNEVKGAELEWSGVLDWLDMQQGRVTKEQVSEYLKRGGVRVEEVVLAAAGYSFANMSRAELARAYEEIVGYDPVEDDPEITNDELREQLIGFADNASKSDGITEDGRPAPKYGEYQLPGGENYREVLLTLPANSEQSFDQWLRDRNIVDPIPAVELLSRSEWIAEMKKNGSAQYRSRHWDQPNVLAHIRMNDRTDADGKRVLFIEEIQSDWGQEGKKKGFAQDTTGWRVQQREDSEDPSQVEIIDRAGRVVWQGTSNGTDSQTIARAVKESTVPAAPFVTKTDGWLNLALKRVITIAVQEGYDRVAFINGEQSASRYDLSQQVGSITTMVVGDGRYNLRVRSLSDEKILSEDNVDLARIEALVGKDIAKKVEARDGEPTGLGQTDARKLTGVDLKVGGEGMRAFYDQIVPNATRALLKKLGGGQMNSVNLGDRLLFGDSLALYVEEPVTPREAMDWVENNGADDLLVKDADGKFVPADDQVNFWNDRYEKPGDYIYDLESQGFDEFAVSRRAKEQNQPGFDITDAMREKVAGGLPLFDRTGSAVPRIPVPQIPVPREIASAMVGTSPRLATVMRRWEAGEVGEEALGAAVRAELDARRERREDRDQRKRVRGADWLREKFIRARRTGQLDPSQTDLALWLIDKNPAIADDLGISIEEGNEETPNGVYKVLERIVVVFSSKANEDTATHEILHHTERMLPQPVRDKIRAEWLKQLRLAVAAANRNMDASALDNAGPAGWAGIESGMTEEQKASMRTRLAWMLEAAESGDDQFALKLWSMKPAGERPVSDLIDYKLAAASEFWAVNGAALMRKRAESQGSWIATARRWYTELIAKVRELLGLPSDAAVLRGIRAVLVGDGSFVSNSMLSDLGGSTLRRDETAALIERRARAAVTQFLQGSVKPTDTIGLGNTPGVLVDLGVPPLPLQIQGRTLDKVLNGKHTQQITPDQLIEAIAGVVQPVAVFKDSEGIVALTRIQDRRGNPIVIPIHLQERDGRLTVNRITSAYGLENSIARLAQRARAGQMLYAEKTNPEQSTTWDALFSAEVVQAARDSGSSFVLGGQGVNPDEMADRTPPKRDSVTAEALRRAGVPEDNRGMAERVRDRISGAWQSVRASMGADGIAQGAFDQFHAIKVAERTLGNLPAEQSGYVAARFSTGLPSLMTAVLRDGAPQWRDGILQKVQGSKGLLDVFAPVKDDFNDWIGWMVGRRARVLARQGRENNLTDEHIEALLRLGEGKEERYRAVAAEFAAFKRAILDVAEGAGLIDATTRPMWDQSDWIPFYRAIADQDRPTAPGNRRGLSGQSSGIRRLRGGDSALNDPLENILMNFSHLLDASLKNHALRLTIDNIGQQGPVQRVGREVKPAIIPASQLRTILLNEGVPEELVDSMGEDVFAGMQRVWSITPPTDPDVVRVMRDGKPEWYRITDPLLLRSLTAVSQDAYGPAARAIVEPLRWFKRILTRGVTATPDFMLRNFIRDSMASQIITKDRMVPIASAVKGAYKSLTESGGGLDMMMAGASFVGGHYNASDPKAAADNMRRALRAKGWSSRRVDDLMATIVDTPAKLWEQWERVGSAVENANREAVYEAALKAGKSKARAAYEAKDLMDYSMRGDWAIMQFLGDVLPFFNARLQGLYKLARATTDDGTAGVLGTAGVTLAKHVAIRGSILMLATLALMAANDGEDWYEELEDWDRDTFWHMRVMGQHIRIPKPFEVGVIFATIPERIYRRISGTDDTKTLVKQLAWNVHSTLAINPIPQAFLPAAEAYMNYSMFTGRPIEGMADEGKLPSARYSERTSPTIRALVETAPQAFDKIGMSPKRAEYLVRGYLGDMGAYALSAADAVTRLATDAPPQPALRPEEIPLIKSFVRGDPSLSSKWRTELYEMHREVERIYRTVNAFENEDLGDRADALERRDAAKLDMRDELVASTRELGEIGKEMDEILRDRKMTREQKRAELDKLIAEQNAIARDAARATRAPFRGL